jgi:hypothetical protein
MSQIGLVEGAGIVVVLAYLFWLFLFFQYFRGWIMGLAGQALGERVSESSGALDGGTYSTAGGSIVKAMLVALIDLVVILCGTVGVAALVFIPAFLVAESGLPYRLESALTGTAAHIEAAVFPAMTAENLYYSDGVVRVVSGAEETVAGCRVRVADYRADNGYLSGTSSYFDLRPNETREVSVQLSAISPPPGTITFQLRLECGERFKDQVEGEVLVGG